MLFSLRRQLTLSVATLLVLAHISRPWPAAGGPRPQPLSTADRGEVNRMLQEYRAAGSDVEKKQEICQKVLAIGSAAAPLALAAVERDLQPQLRKYCSKFQAQATAATKQKVGRVNMNKVMEARGEVQILEKSGEGLTKDVIVEKIEPVVRKLQTTFILDRDQVLDKSPDLAAERKKLQALGRIWEQCQAQLPPPRKTKEQEKTTPPSFETGLEGEEDMAAFQAVPQDPKARAVLAMNAKLAEKLDPEEARAILALNMTRNLLGLPACHRSAALRGGPRALPGHGETEVLFTRVARAGQEELRGSGQACRHHRQRREHLRRHGQRQVGPRGLVPQPRPPPEPDGQLVARRRRPQRYVLHADVRRLTIAQKHGMA